MEEQVIQFLACRQCHRYLRCPPPETKCQDVPSVRLFLCQKQISPSRPIEKNIAPVDPFDDALEFAQGVAGGIEPSNDGPCRCADYEVDRHARFLEGAQDSEMSESPRPATRECEGDPRLRLKRMWQSKKQ